MIFESVPLNTFTIVDANTLRMQATRPYVNYFFFAEEPTALGGCLQFSCRVHVGLTQASEEAYVRIETVGSDKIGQYKATAFGTTIDELIHNLDLALKPSERHALQVAWSKLLVKGTATAVGPAAFLETPPEQAAQFRSIALAQSVASKDAARALERSSLENKLAAPSAPSLAFSDNDIEKQILHLIRVQLGNHRIVISMLSDLEADLELDSLDYLELVLSLEESFEIEILDKDMEEWDTVEDIVVLVKRLAIG